MVKWGVSLMNDTHLIACLFTHDRRAVSSFYRTYAPQLRRYISARVRTADDAEEILQDTLFSFLEAIRDFQGKSTIRTYIFSICQHKIIDYYRKKKLKHVVFSQMPQLESLISPIIGPEEELDATLVKEKINVVLSRLLPVHREVLTLKYWEQVSVDDIARKLSISFKSAESRLFRARRAFVELFLSM